jgi:hypothetical protein
MSNFFQTDLEQQTCNTLIDTLNKTLNKHNLTKNENILNVLFGFFVFVLYKKNMPVDVFDEVCDTLKLAFRDIVYNGEHYND